jgi:hypothetical protein
LQHATMQLFKMQFRNNEVLQQCKCSTMQLWKNATIKLFNNATM